MKVNKLLFLKITSSDLSESGTNKLYLPLKSYPRSTCEIPRMPDKQSLSNVFRLIFLLFLVLPLNLSAQPGLNNRVNSRVNDSEVTVKVDKPSAPTGETVTITLEGIPEGKKATVTVGEAFGQSDVSVSEDSDAGTYTFTMPDYAVYINVKIEAINTTIQSYPLTIETPGVADGKVTVTVEGSGVTGDAASGYRAEAGKEVTVTLKTPLADKLKLTKTEAFAPDGSWRWADLTGNLTATTLTFMMPATAVTVRFALEEDTTPDIPDVPDVPDVPDTPDIPDVPDVPETVYYTVTLPRLEGAVTDPAAGNHQVESDDHFIFYLLLDAAYDQSVPVVTTGDGETLTPRVSDGAYIVKNVRSDMEISIDGIRRNAATANEAVGLSGWRLRTAGGMVSIVSDCDCEATVYTFGGRAVRRLHLTGGSEQQFTLPRGAYLLCAGKRILKFHL